MFSFGKSNRLSQYLTHQGEPIESKESVRDLGIIFQSNGKFIKVVAKSDRVRDLSIIFRSNGEFGKHIIKVVAQDDRVDPPNVKKPLKEPLREKCPKTEFFLVRIFPYSDQKKLRIWTLFMQ